MSFPQDFELDCSGFDGLGPSPSYASASSFNSLSSASQRGLSRSRCVNNLSSLGCPSSEASDARQVSSHYASGPNQGYGYFVDTPSR